MRGLLQLAGWGVAATAALLIAVIAANSTGGQQRLSSAYADVSGARQADIAKAEAAQAALLARLGANENDTRRLVEMVRSLAGDRERLMNRVSVLERSLEDITGAIQRQAALTPPAAAPSTGASGMPQPPGMTPPKSSPAEPAASAGATPEPLKRPANAAAVPDLQALEARPAAGVDVGGARDFDGLRTLWTTLSAAHPDLFEGLQPIVTVREDGKSRTADLRLVAGPLTDVDSASRICSTLAAAKRYCRLVAFEGQPLALNAPPSPPRRPATTAPKPRPTAKATP